MVFNKTFVPFCRKTKVMSRYKDIQFNLGRYFAVESYELTFYRIIMGLVAFFMPVYGYILIWIDSSAIEYIHHRLLISVLYLALFIGTFVHPFFRKYVLPLSYLANCITWTWISWIVMVNQFAMDYVLGLGVSISCIGIIYRNARELIAYFLYLSTVIFSFYFFTIDPECSAIHLLVVSTLIVFFQLLVISRRDLLKENLAKKHNELIKKNKELQQFVHIASHDLKTPIRTIGSFSSLIKKRVDNTGNEELMEFSQYVEDGAKQMNILIEDLLRYSNISHSIPQFLSFNLEKMIENQFNFPGESNGMKKETITFEGKAPQNMIANKNQINQLFLNLIDNGFKYNRSPQKKVHITMGEDPSFWNFSIKDNGIGIDEIYTDKIFSIFGRLHGKNEFEGTGIGLAICQRIIENHGGQNFNTVYGWCRNHSQFQHLKKIEGN